LIYRFKPIYHVQDLALRMNDCTLDYVRQLANVAGPGMALQVFHRSRRDRRDRFAKPLGVTIHEVLDQ
jgi:hypothetical protein